MQILELNFWEIRNCSEKKIQDFLKFKILELKKFLGNKKLFWKNTKENSPPAAGCPDYFTSRCFFLFLKFSLSSKNWELKIFFVNIKFFFYQTYNQD